MYQACEDQPQGRLPVFALRNEHDCKHGREGAKISRHHVLVKDVERSTGNWEGEQGREQRDPAPSGSCLGEAFAA